VFQLACLAFAPSARRACRRGSSLCSSLLSQRPRAPADAHIAGLWYFQTRFPIGLEGELSQTRRSGGCRGEIGGAPPNAMCASTFRRRQRFRGVIDASGRAELLRSARDDRAVMFTAGNPRTGSLESQARRHCRRNYHSCAEPRGARTRLEDQRGCCRTDCACAPFHGSTSPSYSE
jgi:hypothetical protein